MLLCVNCKDLLKAEAGNMIQKCVYGMFSGVWVERKNNIFY